MITKSKKSLLFLYTVIILLLVVVSFINISDNHSSEKSPKETIERKANIEVLNTDGDIRYIDYLDKYTSNITSEYEKRYLAYEVITTNNEIISIDDSFNYGFKTIKLENKQTASFSLEVERSGLYEIYIDYYFSDNSINDVEGNFKINNDIGNNIYN